jgi:16S rRNA (cytosine967-C5)-methyltransferase
LKIDREHLIEKLTRQGLSPFPASFSGEGILLKDPPPTSELPFLKEGLYLIQDEASQLIAPILDPRPGERILDACAARRDHGSKMKRELCLDPQKLIN